MNKTINYSNVCRYLCIIGSIALTMINTPITAYALFILLALIIVINSQIRFMLLKNRLFLASIIFEIALVELLYSKVGGFIYLILFSTLIDSVMRLKGETYILFIIKAAVLAYLVYPNYSLDLMLIILLFYSIIFLLLLHLRQELALREDTELLYDQIRKSNYELEATKGRILEYSKQVERGSQLEERNRISRELHDSIGHSLTGILMQVDAAIQLLPINREKGMEILNSAYENINTSIEVVRQTVRSLRPSIYQTYMSSLRELTKKFSKETGVNVSFEVSGVPYPLYPSVEIAIFKNIREALTNAVRHGNAHNIEINLGFYQDNIQLTIKDDGVGCSHIVKGFGISGIEERLELVGGSLTFSGEKGFCITMTIPRKELD